MSFQVMVFQQDVPHYPTPVNPSLFIYFFTAIRNYFTHQLYIQLTVFMLVTVSFLLPSFGAFKPGLL